MIEFIAAALPLLVGAGVVGGALWYSQKQMKQYVAAFENDPEFEAVPKSWQGAIRTRREPVVTVTAAGGGKNNPRRWDAASFAPHVGARTTLHLAREGLTGKIRELAGFKDVRTGDSAFDERFTVRGAEPDAIRGILANDVVREAIASLFELSTWTVDVRGERGVVTVRCARSGMEPERAREVGRRVRALVDALEQHGNDPPLREAISGGSVGGSATGAPVGVPIGGR
jgi:hypothetical protein